MSEVKIFRIKGRILKQNYDTAFTKDISSTTEKAAVEKIYADLGSQHKVSRVHVQIASVQEIKPNESANMLIRQLNEVR